MRTSDGLRAKRHPAAKTSQDRRRGIDSRAVSTGHRVHRESRKSAIFRQNPRANVHESRRMFTVTGVSSARPAASPQDQTKNFQRAACRMAQVGSCRTGSSRVSFGWKTDIDEGSTRASTKLMLRIEFLAAGLIALSGCSDGCANNIVASAEAPDGLHTAVIFQRDCGATSGFSTQVSLVGPGGEPSGVGNTFRADDYHGEAATGDWGGPWVELRWLAPDHLLIGYAAKSRLFKDEDKVSGVKISYRFHAELEALQPPSPTLSIDPRWASD